LNNAKYRDAIYESRELADLKDLVCSSVALYAGNDAFLVKDAPGAAYRPIRYFEMKDDIDSLGTALSELGLIGKKVAVIGENRYEWVISYLAVANGAGVIVPIDRELMADEIRGFLARAGVSAVIHSGKCAKKAAEASEGLGIDFLISMEAAEEGDGLRSLPALIAMGRQLLGKGRRAYLDIPIDPNAACALLFTSGTTGPPKGVMLSHRNIASNIHNMSKYVRVREGQTGLSVLPMHHAYEMSCHILVAMFQGGRVAICEGLKHILKNIVEAEVSVMLGVPLLFENMHRKVWRNAESKGKAGRMRLALALSKRLHGRGAGLSKWLFREVHQVLGGKMELMIVGGAPVDPKVVEDFNAMGLNMIQGYGMTENSPIIAVNRDRCSKPDSVGFPMQGTEVRIVDMDDNGIGEIICRGDSVMLGYYEDEEESRRVMEDGWLHTGDFGYFDDEGFLYVTGRKKNIIVTKNGKNISPEEIECYLCQIPYVDEVVVWGKDDARRGDTVICADIFPDIGYAEETHGGPLSIDDWKRVLKREIDGMNERMPLYKRVKRFAIRDEAFEKTTTQKIKRYVLEHER
jgi:long-chain acyl-CoA synthetase